MKDTSHIQSFVSGSLNEPLSNEGRKRMGDHEKHTIDTLKKDHNHKKPHVSKSQAKKEMVERKQNQPTIMFTVLIYSWTTVFMAAIVYWIFRLFGPEIWT